MNINIIPSRSTHQAALRVMRRKGGGFFVGKYAKSGAKLWAKELAAKMAPYRPKEPLRGPVCVEIAWVFPYPSSTPDKKRLELSWRMQRPDLDNMEKGVLDLLTSEGFLVDDSQVVFKLTTKMNGVVPCIKIVIRPLDNQPRPDSLTE